MLLVFACDSGFSEGHHELLSVVRELENLLPHVVDDPDVPFRIVWADLDLVRTAATLEQAIPLCPRLDHFSGSIDDDYAIAHYGRRRQRRTDRAKVSVEVVGQLFGQFDFTSVEQKHTVRTFGEDATL